MFVEVTTTEDRMRRETSAVSVAAGASGARTGSVVSTYNISEALSAYAARSLRLKQKTDVLYNKMIFIHDTLVQIGAYRYYFPLQLTMIDVDMPYVPRMISGRFIVLNMRSFKPSQGPKHTETSCVTENYSMSKMNFSFGYFR